MNNDIWMLQNIKGITILCYELEKYLILNFFHSPGLYYFEFE